MKLLQINLPRFVSRAIPLLLLIAYILLTLQPDLRLAVPALTGLTGALVLLLAFILYWGERHQPNWPVWLILAVALIIRFLFFGRPPELSDDIYRYLWDGLQLLSGNNPYSQAPAEAVATTAELQEIKNSINHPGLVTIYGPTAQVFFGFASLFGGTLPGFKAALILVDLGCCYLLCRLLFNLGLPVWRSVLYAWNPLPVLEISGSGHIDGVGLFFLLAALFFVVERKNKTDKNIFAWLTGLLCGCGFLVKLFPAIFLPGFLLLRPKQRWPFLSAFVLGAILLTLPFLPEISNGLHTLQIYTANWEFSSFSFRTLRGLLKSSLSARLVLSFVFLIGTAWLYFLFYQKSRTADDRDAALAMLKTFYALSFLYLLLTPTLHPWYGLYLVIFLPFAAGPAGLVLNWSLFLGYQVLIPYTILGQWRESDLTAFLIWLGPIAALGLAMLINKKRHPFAVRKGYPLLKNKSSD